MFIFYNDEHPEGNTSFTMGHTKGVIAYDKKVRMKITKIC
jgi:hypothetical protein